MRLDWIASNAGRLAELSLAHLALSLIPVLASVLIAVPLAWWAHRRPWLRQAALTGSGILYALPSLPLFVILPVILGTRILDPLNLVVALTFYGVALLLRTAVDAFVSVGQASRHDAEAVGHSPGQVFWRVALPLAGPALLAGTRVVSASTISLVSVGALIGVPSLGSLFTDGYQRSFPTEIWVGLVATVLLALAVDVLLLLLGRILMPWVRATTGRAA